MKNKNLEELKAMQSVEADLEIARRVGENKIREIHYFMGEFSVSVLKYIARLKNIARYVKIGNTVPFNREPYENLIGEYYKFIGADFLNGVPKWEKVKSYKSVSEKDKDKADVRKARLKTYIINITKRHFNKIIEQMDKEPVFEGDTKALEINIAKNGDLQNDVEVKEILELLETLSEIEREVVVRKVFEKQGKVQIYSAIQNKFQRPLRDRHAQERIVQEIYDAAIGKLRKMLI